MKKTIWAVMAVLVIIMSISCGGSPKTSTEAEILADFDPKGFAAAGIEEYFRNPSGTAEASFEASFAAVRTGNSGTATVNASFNDYPYGDYIVTGDFVYTLPVESGKILGYRMETAGSSSPTFTDTASGKETQFSVTMDDSALAPAGGDYNTATGTVTNGTAAPMLSGTEASFTVGNMSVGLGDIPTAEKPYTRNMMAEDLYSLMMANGPLSAYALKLLMAQMPSTGMPEGTFTADLGNGNTYTVTYTENSTHAEMRIINPMDFVVSDSTGKTYSVHTNGKVSVVGGSSVDAYGGSAEVEYNDFVSTIIVTGGSEPETYTSRKVNGTYSMDLSSSEVIDGSITIGNHTYSGASYKELVALYALDMTITQFWHYAVIGEDGSYLNTLGGTEDSPIIVEGNYNDATGTLDGEIRIYGTAFPFIAKAKFTEGGYSTIGTFLDLSYSGVDFTEEDVGYLNAIYELNYAFSSLIM